MIIVECLAPTVTRAVPMLYDINFDAGVYGFITGQVSADFDARTIDSSGLGSAPVNAITLTFAGVTFDQNYSMLAQSAIGAADFTGLMGVVTSSTVQNANLHLNTCDGVNCVAFWGYVPDISADLVQTAPQGSAVTPASVPEPGPLSLLSVGLAG